MKAISKKFENGQIAGWHLQPGPNGGIMSIRDTTIIDKAKAIVDETLKAQQRNAGLEQN